MVRCAGGPSGIIAVCIALGALGSPLGDERGTLYFADPAAGAIFRSRLDGSGLQVIISGLSEPMDLALDAARGRLFWCDAGTNKIQSSFLNGSDVRDVVVLGAGIISSIAVDSVRGRLFWLLRNGKIQRAGLDGAGRADVHVFEDPVNLEGIAVDPLSGWIYWSDAISRRIRRAGHDFGWHALVAALETGSSPSAVALDALAGLVCWADTFADRIECSGLDGKNRRTIVTGLKVAKGLALDHHGGKVYWSDNQVRAVYRANMDGSQREELIATGLQGVHGLAVLPMVTTTSTTTSTASTATSTTSYTTTATTSTATTSTTNNITTSTTTCFDVNYAATDLYGDTCGWYASRLGRCGDHDDEDFKADYMCCVCGGGSAGELFKPSTIRTTTTSTTSTFTSTTTTTTEAHRYGRKVPPPTKLALAVRAGATEIEVLISEGFRIGDQISIGDEQNEVVGFGSLVLATPLTKNHPAGTKVAVILQVTSAAPGNADLESGGDPDGDDVTLAPQDGDKVRRQEESDTTAVVAIAAAIVCVVVLCLVVLVFVLWRRLSRTQVQLEENDAGLVAAIGRPTGADQAGFIARGLPVSGGDTNETNEPARGPKTV